MAGKRNRRRAQPRQELPLRIPPAVPAELFPPRFDEHPEHGPVHFPEAVVPSPFLVLIMGYLGHLGFTDVPVRPIPAEYQYWVDAYNNWLGGMRQINVPAVTLSDGPEQGMLPLTCAGEDRVWDSFHQFVYEYLRTQGMHGLDFKYRALDGTKPPYPQLQEFLQHIVYQDVNTPRFHPKALGNMLRKCGCQVL